MTDQPVHGSNGSCPHGMVRFGTEWRHVYPDAAGVLTVPHGADEFVLVGGGGGADGGGGWGGTAAGSCSEPQGGFVVATSGGNGANSARSGGAYEQRDIDIDVDPAVLMAQLRRDPRMDGTPMRIEFPDGSVLRSDPPHAEQG